MLDKRYELFKRALEVSGIGPGPMARRLGVTVRTTQRWRLGTGIVHTSHMQTLAELVEDKDPDLARELRDNVDDFLRSQGMALPERPDLSAVQNEPAVRLADDLVKTAARALGVPVEKVRPTLRGALSRAQGAGLTLEGLLRAIDRGAPR